MLKALFLLDRKDIMKRILLLMILLLIPFICQAKTYVVIDKEMGEVKGVVDITDEARLEWTQFHILKEVGEEFRGKTSDEIKVSGNAVKLATDKEIGIKQQENILRKQVKEKEKILTILGITEEQLEAIKK